VDIERHLMKVLLCPKKEVGQNFENFGGKGIFFSCVFHREFFWGTGIVC